MLTPNEERRIKTLEENQKRADSMFHRLLSIVEKSFKSDTDLIRATEKIRKMTSERFCLLEKEISNLKVFTKTISFQIANIKKITKWIITFILVLIFREEIVDLVRSIGNTISDLIRSTGNIFLDWWNSLAQGWQIALGAGIIFLILEAILRYFGVYLKKKFLKSSTSKPSPKTKNGQKNKK